MKPIGLNYRRGEWETQAVVPGKVEYEQRNHFLNGLRGDFRCLHWPGRHRRSNRWIPVAVGWGDHRANLPGANPGIAHLLAGTVAVIWTLYRIVAII